MWLHKIATWFGESVRMVSHLWSRTESGSWQLADSEHVEHQASHWVQDGSRRKQLDTFWTYGWFFTKVGSSKRERKRSISSGGLEEQIDHRLTIVVLEEVVRYCKLWDGGALSSKWDKSDKAQVLDPTYFEDFFLRLAKVYWVKCK